MGIVDPDTPGEDIETCMGSYEAGNKICDVQCGMKTECQIMMVNEEGNKLDYVIAVMENATSND